MRCSSAGVSRLLLTAAGILSAVALLFNPWRHDRVSERVPAIVQDVIVIALFALAATVLLDEKLLTTSAVGAVVVGFALQDTLGNLFAGLAIQVEKPFRVGQWIRVGDFEGKVQEVTWRATKLLTKAGEFVIVPNSVMSKDPILNYSEPTVPSRLEVDRRRQLRRAAQRGEAGACTRRSTTRRSCCRRPGPTWSSTTSRRRRSTTACGSGWRISAATAPRATRCAPTSGTPSSAAASRFRIRFKSSTAARKRRPGRPSGSRRSPSASGRSTSSRGSTTSSAGGWPRAASSICSAPVNGSCARAPQGHSMFVVLDGRVRVSLEPSGQEVATIARGGFFGEMSMLTGEPRTATVTAADDAVLLEITAERFRELAVHRPAIVEQVSDAVSARRAGARRGQGRGRRGSVDRAGPRQPGATHPTFPPALDRARHSIHTGCPVPYTRAFRGRRQRRG